MAGRGQLVALLVGVTSCVDPAAGAGNRAITGGEPTAGDPAVVALVVRTAVCGEPAPVFCTGTLVGPRAVLTAAHCVDDQPTSSFLVASPDQLAAGTGSEVVAAAIHPAYGGDSPDLAVLELGAARSESPAPLRADPMTSALVGSDVRIVGYGVDDDGATGSKRQGVARIDTVDAETFGIEPGPGMTCDGDSGGPILLSDEVAGVVSFGDASCTMSGTNGRVDVFRDFIDGEVAAIAAGPEPVARPAIDPFADYCAAPCAGDADCPVGMSCVDRGEGLRCALQGGDVGNFTGACTGADDCAGVCLSGVAGDDCLCFVTCDQLDDGDGCCSAGADPPLGALLLVLLPLLARRRLVLVVLLALVACGDDGMDGPPVLFEELTATGLSDAVVPPDPGDRPCEEPTPFPCTVSGASFGVGAAAADVDGDGRVDLYLAGPGGGELYRNQTAPDGPIALAAAGGLPATDAYVHAAAFGDLDGDGDADLVLGLAAGLAVLENDGAGAFTDRTAAILTALDLGRSLLRGTGVTLGDLDGDGRLDIYLAEYGMPGTATEQGAPGLLLLNRGDFAFDDAAALWPRRHAWAGLMADLDRDGRLELFIASELWRVDEVEQPSSLYWNDGLDDGGLPRLTEDADLAAAFDRYSTPMGAAAADPDGDGDLELAVSMQGPALYLGREAGAGDRELSISTFFGPLGVEDAYRTSWAVALEDFDRDGQTEALMTAGAPCLPEDCVVIPPSQQPELYEFEDQIFDFPHQLPVEGAGGLAGPEGDYRNQRGLVLVDLDGDGRDELLVTPFNDRFRLYRNVASGGHYIRIVPVGTSSAPTPVGAEVTVTAGGRSQTRQLTAGGSTHASHGPGLLFELGNATAVDGIEIRWPGGRVQDVEPALIDGVQRVREPP